jgi:uncharacterized cupredoxin-like copper-binding protein
LIRALCQRCAWFALAAAILSGLWFGEAASAADPAAINVTLKDHRFSPSEIRVPAGKPVVLHIKNEDSTAEEFDSDSLKVEKVIAGRSEGTVRIRPLDPGHYEFIGEYHAETAKGVVIAE